MTDTDDVVVPTGKTLWLLAYDLKTEFIHKSKQVDKEWLAKTRVSIWYDLRYRYKCAPVQKSLYIVRDPLVMEKLHQSVEGWLKMYKERGFPANIRIFPLSTTDDGFKVFQDMEFDFVMEWLMRLAESMRKYNSAKPPTKRFLGDAKRKIELLESIVHEDFTPQYPRYVEGDDTIQLLHDRVLELSQWAK